jgi:hypothetical protein
MQITVQLAYIAVVEIVQYLQQGAHQNECFISQ